MGAGQPGNDQDLSSQGPVEVRGGGSAQVGWHLQACGSRTDKRKGSRESGESQLVAAD